MSAKKSLLVVCIDGKLMVEHEYRPATRGAVPDAQRESEAEILIWDGKDQWRGKARLKRGARQVGAIVTAKTAGDPSGKFWADELVDTKKLRARIADAVVVGLCDGMKKGGGA